MNFCPPFWGAKIFYSRYSLASCWSGTDLAALGLWPIDAYSPNLVNFGLGVPQCRVTTCVSPSLMHLFNVSFIFVG